MRAPVVVALAGLVALPFALAAPSCTPTCSLLASVSAGFTPSLVVVHGGATVTWTGADVFNHKLEEGALDQLADPSCFDQPVYRDIAVGRVTFTLEGTSVVATSGDARAVCTSAIATPAGMLLHYRCDLHVTMRGALLVTA
ncbi:MAG: cupredoxin domain-containing protein [Thermoplasmatota archaeon]